MANIKKKVLLFLVEGISDEISFEGLWESFFENNEVRVYVLRCDITTQDFSSPATILSKLKQPIDRFLNSTKLKKDDIQKIVHLIDTDGAFVPESCVEQKYAGRLSDFLAFISSSEFAVKMDYKDSWNFIMESTNSLHRHSNIHLLFSNR